MKSYLTVKYDGITYRRIEVPKCSSADTQKLIAAFQQYLKRQIPAEIYLSIRDTIPGTLEPYHNWHGPHPDDFKT